MLWMLLSAASCCRFVMPEENFPDIVAWSRLELFLNVLSTGVLSVTIRRPISTHGRMESRCLTSFAPSPWCQVVDQTVTSGTNGLRMPYCDKAQRRLRRYWGSGFESRHFTCFFFEWQNRRCWCSAILLKMDVSREREREIYIYNKI